MDDKDTDKQIDKTKDKKEHKHFNSKKASKRSEYRWVIIIVLITFLTAIMFTFLSESPNIRINPLVSLIILIVFMFLGIVADMISTAVTAADSPPFHSMSSRKIAGAKESILLLKNAEKVSNFFGDVIGDIVGIVNGSIGATLSFYISGIFNVNEALCVVFTLAFISSATVGSKAIGKSLAIRKCEQIIFFVGKFIYLVSFWKKRQ